jgi:hypothetical protein
MDSFDVNYDDRKRMESKRKGDAGRRRIYCENEPRDSP